MSERYATCLQESFEELLYKKRAELRKGFDLKGDEMFCLVPHEQFSSFVKNKFNISGQYYMHTVNPAIEYFGFILVSAYVNEVKFVVEI